MNGFYILAILWLPMGIFCLLFMAKKIGYLRWSDLGIILFGPLWFITPYWWDESGRRMWPRRSLLFGWRWHFRMSRCGQVLLKLAHRKWTPRWMHDAIECVVYGNDGLR